MNLLKLAWKNVWRNKLRSFVMLFAITLGLTGGTFLVGFMNGWVAERIQDVIDNEMTHLQINTEQFIDQPDLENNFLFSPTLISAKSINPNILGVSPRIIVNGMVASAHKTMGIQIYGIDSEMEKTVSKIHESIADSLGNYFTENKEFSVVIGADLADELRLKLNSKLIVSMVDANGEQVSAAFRICGIFNIGNPSFDKSKIFVQKDDLAQLIGLNPHNIHELVIKLNSEENRVLDKAKADVIALVDVDKSQAESSKLTVRSWKDISMMMAVYSDFLKYELMVIVGLILMALGFGIVNTILMSVVERRRELSMLMAIGMPRRKVRLMIILETTMLTSFGGFIGMILGWLLIVSTNAAGIDVSTAMESVGEIGFPTVIHPQISTGLFFGIVVLVMLTGIIAAYYPAKNASKLNPAEGVRS